MAPEPQTLSEVKEPAQTVEELRPVFVQEPESVRSSITALAARLPLQLDLKVPLPSFRVHNLLALEKGQVIESAWPHTEDLPLWSGGVHLVWTEFEVVDQKLAVRVTRLV
jgi:flagellar motor switch protein FliN/FliY